MGEKLNIVEDKEKKTYCCSNYTLNPDLSLNYLLDVPGMIESDIVNSFSELYLIYSPFLTQFDTLYKNFTFFYPNKRTLSYDIAYLVDSYFNGEYISETGGYEYHFYGDYEKPVIYLYPEEKTDVSVKVNIKDGELTCTYPGYGNGWNVTAYPDGKVINKADNREYSYLYWEGKGEVSWDMSDGFVVKGSDTVEFLQQKLEYMGLTPEEYNEFIVYWLPLMKDNNYNLIKFQTDDYTDMAKLDISPAPDSMLRVFMTFVPLDEKIDVPEQHLDRFERNGFTVVEWGGAELKETK